eukprot:g4191.t1
MLSSRTTGVRRSRYNQFNATHDIFGKRIAQNGGCSPNARKAQQRAVHNAAQLRGIAGDIASIKDASEDIRVAQSNQDVNAGFRRMNMPASANGPPRTVGERRALHVAAQDRAWAPHAIGSVGPGKPAAVHRARNSTGRVTATARVERLRRGTLRQAYVDAESRTGGPAEVDELLRLMREQLGRRCRSHAAQALWLRNTFERALRYGGDGTAAVSERAANKKSARGGIGVAQLGGLLESLQPGLEHAEVTAIFGRMDRRCRGGVGLHDVQGVLAPHLGAAPRRLDPADDADAEPSVVDQDEPGGGARTGGSGESAAARVEEAELRPAPQVRPVPQPEPQPEPEPEPVNLRRLANGHELVREPECDVTDVELGEAWVVNPERQHSSWAHPALQQGRALSGGKASSTIEEVMLADRRRMYRVRCKVRVPGGGRTRHDERLLFFDTRNAAVAARLAFMHADRLREASQNDVLSANFRRDSAGSTRVASRGASKARPQSAGASRYSYGAGLRSGTSRGTYNRHAAPAWVSQAQQQASSVRPSAAIGVRSPSAGPGTTRDVDSRAACTTRPAVGTVVLTRDKAGAAGSSAPLKSMRPASAPKARSPTKPAQSMNYLRGAQDLSHVVAHTQRSAEEETTDQELFQQHYILGRFLDKGAFACVRLGWARAKGGEQGGASTQVAIKTYDRKKMKQSKEPGKLRHLEQELALVGKFEHANVLCPTEKYVTADHVHLVMEYAQSGSLARYVRSARRMHEHTVRGIFRQVAAGVAFLHANNLCHRDIKMENCVVTKDGVVKLVDFGLGAKTDENICSTRACDWRRCTGCALVVHTDADHEFDYRCRRGKPHGIGVFTLESGDIYSGNFKQGVMHGTGRYIWRSGAEYSGSWVNDKMEGHGVLEGADGSRFEGTFRDGAVHGQGTYVWTSGANYTGDFKDGQQHGFGTWTLADGSRYTGGFREGLRHGTGRWEARSIDGKIEYSYDGQWARGKRHGLGKYTLATGHVLDGEFKDDLLHGTATKTDSKGTVLSHGQWAHGKLVPGAPDAESG